MSALRLAHPRRPAPARHRITVRQFQSLLAAIRELPTDDAWRDAIPAPHELQPMPLIPADPDHIPF